MDLNLDEGHAKCVGESSHPKTLYGSNCLHEPIPSYFINIYYLFYQFYYEYGKPRSFWVLYLPYYQIYVSTPT